jgi:hypothetical protein
LEEALLELQRVNESMLAAMEGRAGGEKAAPIISISAESARLLGEIKGRQRSYCPVSGLERPVTPPQPAQAVSALPSLYAPHGWLCFMH